MNNPTAPILQASQKLIVRVRKSLSWRVPPVVIDLDGEPVVCVSPLVPQLRPAE